MNKNPSYRCPWCQVSLKVAQGTKNAEMRYLPTHAANRLEATRNKWCKGSRMPVSFNNKDGDEIQDHD